MARIGPTASIISGRAHPPLCGGQCRGRGATGQGITLYVQVSNVFDKRYTTAAQLGATAFDAAGRFVARPFAAPVIDGERPLLHASFQAPGAPRSAQFGMRLGF
ncbi:hypothetical protein MOP88_13310 [Sphingomonas sp. WKB10]|nr:hypothetical protein [Sphingomonas sp. WKB10]